MQTMQLPDRHVLVDVVDISEHNFAGQHGEGEGTCERLDGFCYTRVCQYNIVFVNKCTACAKQIPSEVSINKQIRLIIFLECVVSSVKVI